MGKMFMRRISVCMSIVMFLSVSLTGVTGGMDANAMTFAAVKQSVSAPSPWAKAVISQATKVGILPSNFTKNYQAKISRTEWLTLLIAVNQKTKPASKWIAETQKEASSSQVTSVTKQVAGNDIYKMLVGSGYTIKLPAAYTFKATDAQTIRKDLQVINQYLVDKGYLKINSKNFEPAKLLTVEQGLSVALDVYKLMSKDNNAESSSSKDGTTKDSTAKENTTKDKTEVAAETEPLMKLSSANVPFYQPVGQFKAATGIKLQSGYSGEIFIDNTGFNMPIELCARPDGKILISSKREHKLYDITDLKTKVHYQTRTNTSSMAADSKNNIYILDNLTGGIEKVSATGESTIILQKSTEMFTFHESMLVMGPNEDTLLSLSNNTLYQIDMSGKLEVLISNVPQIMEICKTSDGRYIGTSTNLGYEISLDKKTVTQVFKMDGKYNNRANSLAADREGNVYFSNDKKVMKIDRYYKITDVAQLPNESLSGLEWVEPSKMLIGAEKLKGGVYTVNPTTGKVTEIFVGNGLLSPMAIAFSKSGDILISNDDGNNLSITNPEGLLSNFWFHYWAYTPPMPHILVREDDTIFLTADEVVNIKACNLFMVPPEGLVRGGTSTQWIPKITATGIVEDKDGNLIVADPYAGKIKKIDANKNITDLYSGLTFPQALVMDSSDNLYVMTGGTYVIAELHAPQQGDKLIKIAPNGTQTVVAEGLTSSDIAIGPDGKIYACGHGNIWCYDPIANSKTQFASGINMASGMAFDIAGNLYVTSSIGNQVIRISGFETKKLEGSFTLTGNASDYKLMVYKTEPLVSGYLYPIESNGSFSIDVVPGDYTIVLKNPKGAVETKKVSVK